MEDYLALRQQLKQSIRLQKGSVGGGAAAVNSIDNYAGFFFGPSETVFTGRSAEETIKLWSQLKINKSSSSSSFTIADKPIVKNIGSTSKRVEMPKDKKNSNSAEKSQSSSSRANKGFKATHVKKELKIVSKPEAMKKKESMKTCVNIVSKQEEKKKEKRRVEKRRSDYAVELIRQMFGYNPADYSDDDDDLNMEASFADIQKEEKRSARIATKEDRQELRKLEIAESRKKMKHIH